MNLMSVKARTALLAGLMVMLGSPAVAQEKSNEAQPASQTTTNAPPSPRGKAKTKKKASAARKATASQTSASQASNAKMQPPMQEDGPAAKNAKVPPTPGKSDTKDNCASQKKSKKSKECSAEPQ